MYARLENAGLIVGTEEWKKKQEESLWPFGKEKDAGRETDYRQAVRRGGSVRAPYA